LFLLTLSKYGSLSQAASFHTPSHATTVSQWHPPDCGRVSDGSTALWNEASPSSLPTPTPAIAELHDRMPVFLEPQDWPTWLVEVDDDPGAPPKPAGDDVVRAWLVSKQVTSPKNNSGVLEAIE
jgi:hypothetical protein